MADPRARFLITADDRASRTLRKIKGQVGGLSKAFNALSKISPFGFLTGALSGATLGKLTADSIKLADNLQKTADKVGLSVEALQEYQLAAEISGVRTQNFNLAVQRFSRRVGEAANGGGELAKTLDRIGISVRDSSGNIKSVEQLLGEYADAVKEAGSSQEQLGLAFKAFDSEGAALVNLLRKGKEGVDGLRQSAREAGPILSQNLVDTAAKINDRWTILTRTIGQSFTKAAVEAIDAALNLFGVFNNLADVQGRLIELTDDLVLAQINADNAGSPRMARASRARIAEIKKEIVELEELQRTMTEARKTRDAMMTPRGEGSGSGSGYSDTSGKSDAEKEVERLEALAERLQQPYEKLEDQFKDFDFLLKEKKITWDEYAEAMFDALEVAEKGSKTVSELSKPIDDLEDEFKDLKNAVEGWGQSFAETLLSGENDFKGFAESIIRQLAKIAIAEATTPYFSQFGGFIGGSLASLPGFATGGGFTVGGSGGTDSQLVAFRATPGEQVLVKTPAQQGGGGSITVAPVYNIQGGGNSEELRAVMADTTQRTIAMLRDMKQRNQLPEFA